MDINGWEADKMIVTIVLWMAIVGMVCFAGYIFLRSSTQPMVIYFDAYGVMSMNPAKIKDGRLKVYGNMLRMGKSLATFIIEDAPQHPFKAGFFTKPCYICYYGNIKPLRIDDDHKVIGFMESTTLDRTLDNEGIRRILSTYEGMRVETKLLIIVIMAIVGLVFAYAIFIAPNMMPTDSCQSMVNIAKEGIQTIPKA